MTSSKSLCIWGPQAPTHLPGLRAAVHDAEQLVVGYGVSRSIVHPRLELHLSFAGATVTAIATGRRFFLLRVTVMSSGSLRSPSMHVQMTLPPPLLPLMPPANPGPQAQLCGHFKFVA